MTESFAVRVEPGGVVFSAEAGESLRAAAVRRGLVWRTVCDGHGTCGTCHLLVLAGADALSPAGAEEKVLVDRIRSWRGWGADVVVRLGCQAAVYGDVSVSSRQIRVARVES